MGACKYFLKDVMPTLSKVQKAEILTRITALAVLISCENSRKFVLSLQIICWERLQGLVSDGSVYNKSVHWRGRTESVTGFVKSKYTMYSK